MVYCLDNSTLINMWERYYVPEHFQAVWTAMDSLGGGGGVFLCDKVRDEMRNPAFIAWVRVRPHLLRRTGTLELAEVAGIMRDAEWCRLVDPSATSDVADPYVIAHSLTTGAVVVTDERQRRKEAGRPRIPDVCDALGVPYIETWRFVQALMHAAANPPP